MTRAELGVPIAYDYAVLRVLPHPYLGAAGPMVAVGVVVHARTGRIFGAGGRGRRGLG